ncbi:UDP-N-acetylmuramoyl-L-alanine--D-glutamate ligase [Sediminibacterium sp.]|uniref:UDP-N-acetylmuramoyl-L-alanine--D-glutamate ligase n=1 Tax=Sediminibacterium sp. TaxID=1917865 RepID=UPI000BD01BC6|nr:UDP-N-acetylmuramoyl-L-alanine--D-glutamate ligase [Sediminibacterium sp.]MDP3392481.1 UDP-N-acetylmuramoyl-L-alanine--D-glutamate ligase [Sediminibacterium sp.]MDP3565747.1 UDP-N-acetylmuramoyl-L-alanine--D-glutamate ligase [Sediminibacterium sp.]OYW82274.1 MAG: UDP-N-acetylmuramoyl-L-alanine--D-glutamate ligase [Sphingobacteriia bacterium 32-37-4]OYZ00931.1 MAG: UDP-N-acetylmuramoyl-L-alanine--D-glutamate ligase [Sphingobacteriia bacterium 28-36-52]
MSSNIIILGGGESGVGAAVLAKYKGHRVFLSDGGKLKEIYKAELTANGIEFEEGGHSVEQILAADEVVKSPGISEKNEMVKAIRAKGIPVISEIEFAYRYKGDSTIVAITGSNGKSTTTALLYHICKTAELDCAMVGNIGYSFARQVAEDPKPLYIIEVSSFQLDDIKTFRPNVSILLNITEDHLDRYNYQFENYINSKFRIIENQTMDDYFIYCLDDETIMQKFPLLTIHTNPLPFSMKQEVKKGGYIKGDQMMLRIQEERVSMSIYDFALKGKHNNYNTMAAGIAASTIGIRKEKIRDAVKNFHSLEHRMEFIAMVRGVEFINDSKATNVNSTWYALESMNKPTVLILGGVDKGNDYSLIADLVKEKVKAIICMGTDNSKIIAAFKDIVPMIFETDSAKKAVNAAFRAATKDDVVLLSPACASFDLFKNYEDRGTQFKEAVKEL